MPFCRIQIRFVCKISKISEYILSMHFYIIDDFGWFAFFTVSNTNDTNTFASEKRKKTRQQQHSCELHRAIDNWSDEGLNFIRMQFTASHTELFFFWFCTVTERESTVDPFFYCFFSSQNFLMKLSKIGFVCMADGAMFKQEVIPAIWICIDLLGGILAGWTGVLCFYFCLCIVFIYQLCVKCVI